ncbi:putative tubulin polyglutamylase TTLL9 [Acropora cervicornis]|uniref:Tubulin--tyrosine ligase-like protein 9 n=1 Tax=Acropora cervicornis TaxID=6130 RepID=A0AAD9Q1Q3_ACRCE|nr:putative tubulin polyglutamylase TTLL9 [Acropora cervicornis]
MIYRYIWVFFVIIPELCDFFPTTFELPMEYHIFVEEFKRNPGTTWIMKPVGKSQGKGIFLFRKLKDIMDWRKEDPYRAAMSDDRKDEKEAPEAYIVQRYVENPYLIGGRKFDLRVYVLVTSYAPLCAWLYREGFARFSNTRFSLDSIDDTYIHLTNVAIQKTAPDYDAEKGCKWSLQQLRRYLVAKHGIEKVKSKPLIFSLYGYDILIDSKLKPWLIEVNASPSLTASSQSDYELKCRLLEDMLHIVDMENRLTGREKRVGGFDLMWNDGPVYMQDAIAADCIPNPSYPTNTFLGCDNSDRNKQLKQVFKNAQSLKKV